MNTKTLARYSRFGHYRVTGWLTSTAIRAIRNLAETQRTAQVRGPVCEIGVHHGRLFILLCLLRRDGEHALAYDLFGRQAENVDKSGAGDLETLKANLLRHGCGSDRISLIQANSFDLVPERVIAEAGGRPRLFSIDGGHTAAATINDLVLASRTIGEGGIVILDDFFNEAWPGVADGACRFMAGEGEPLAPILIAGNKFAFTSSPAWAQRYQEALLASSMRVEFKRSIVFEQPVIIRRPNLGGKRTIAAFASRRIFGARLNRFVKVE